MNKLTAAVAALLCVAPAVATAAPGGMLGRQIARADANHDGFVTRAELNETRCSALTRLDRNHDGAAALSEAPRLAKSDRPEAVRLRAMFAQADVNHDGRVTQDECRRAPSPMFDQADRDRDGRLSEAEVKALPKGRPGA